MKRMVDEKEVVRDIQAVEGGIKVLQLDGTSKTVEVGGSSTVNWDDIQDKPSFATVATSGDYEDLSNKPSIPAALTAGDDVTITDNAIDTIYGGMTLVNPNIDLKTPNLEWQYNETTSSYQYIIYTDSESVIELGKKWHALFRAQHKEAEDNVYLIFDYYDENNNVLAHDSCVGTIHTNTWSQYNYYVRITNISGAINIPEINGATFRINSNYSDIYFENIANQLVYNDTAVKYIVVSVPETSTQYGPVFDRFIPVDGKTIGNTQSTARIDGNSYLTVKDIPDSILDNKTIVRDSDNKLSTTIGGYSVEIPAKHYETHVMTWQEGTYGYQYQCSPSFNDLTLAEAQEDYHEFENILTGTDSYRTTQITSGLTLQLSTDNVNWDSYDATCTASAGTNLESGYFRFRYLTVADLSISSKEGRIYAQTNNTQEYLNIAQQVDSNQTSYLYAKLVYDQPAVNETHYINSDFINIDGTTIVKDSNGVLSATGSAPANMMTTDTDQTITGLKTFVIGSSVTSAPGFQKNILNVVNAANPASVLNYWYLHGNFIENSASSVPNLKLYTNSNHSTIGFGDAVIYKASEGTALGGIDLGLTPTTFSGWYHWKNYIKNIYAEGGTVIFENLPTTDPQVAGQLWNDNGTVKVSSGN